MRLAGRWYNQLGSMMVLEVSQGQVSGYYETAVGDASGRYKLAGRTDTDDDEVRNVGFVVSWENDHGSSDSVTAWSGQLREVDGEEIITAFWILTIETRPSAEWKSHVVGQDVFQRTKPALESIKREVALGNVSHPLS